MKNFFTFILLLISFILFGQDTTKYVVQAGDNLTKIANSYGVSLNDIYQLNPDLSDVIYVGQVINIMICNITVEDTVKHIVKHIVKQGETLTKISTLYNIKIDDIYKHNPEIVNDMIYIGQTILIVKEREEIINNQDDDQNDDDVIVLEEDPYEKVNCVIETMGSQVGIREKTGNNDGREVEMYLASAGLSKGNPWCASFVNWVYEDCGYYFNLDSPGWVPSWFPNNKLIYVRGKIDKAPPRPGDLIGIWYENKGRLAHIGFYEDQSNDWIISIEGNTNEGGSREGDGVYRKIRLKRTIHSMSSWIY